MCIVENVKIKLAAIPVIIEKNFSPILKITTAVKALKIKEGNLTDKAPTPKNLIKKWSIKK